MSRVPAYSAFAASIVLLAELALAHDPVLVGDLKGNVRARLVAARISERRGGNLIAKFETVGAEPQTLVFDFPAHSLTTHEQTLKAIILSCVEEIGATGRYEWRPSTSEAIFSVPGLPAMRELDKSSRLEHCALISIGRAKGR